MNFSILLLIAAVTSLSFFDYKELYVNPKIEEVQFAENVTTFADETKPILRVYTNSTREIVACLVPNACIKGGVKNQELYIPNQMKSHSKLIQRCVRSNFLLKFINTNSRIGEKTQKQIYVDVDVLGLPFIHPFFKHFAHFGPKFIAFSMLPFSLFASKTRSITPYCISHNNTFKSCDTGKQWPKKPRIVVADKVIHNRKGDWNHDFVHMLSSNSSLLHILPIEDKEQSPLMCFRSVITSPLKYDGTVELHDRLLREKGIIRVHEKEDLCKPHIVVLFRNPDHKVSRAFRRETMESIEEQLFGDLKNVDINASIETIIDLGSGRQLEEQIEVFQKADILATAHGAELTNAFALTSGARLVEISPFGLYDDWFKRTMFASGGHRKKICAPPDRKLLRACIRDRMLKRGEDIKNIDGSKAMKEFDELSRSFQWGQNNPKCHLHEEENRKCVRKQRVLINAVQLSEVIIDQVRSFCYVKRKTHGS